MDNGCSREFLHRIENLKQHFIAPVIGPLFRRSENFIELRGEIDRWRPGNRCNRLSQFLPDLLKLRRNIHRLLRLHRLCHFRQIRLRRDLRLRRRRLDLLLHFIAKPIERRLHILLRQRLQNRRDNHLHIHRRLLR